METLNNIKGNSSSQTDKAILAVKSVLDHAVVANSDSNSITNIEDDLFQSISKAVKISRFVAGTLAKQTEAALTQIYWHSEHSTSEFSDYLSKQLNLQITNEGNLFSGALFELTDFRAELRSDIEIMKILRNIRYQHACAVVILELNNAISIEDSSARMSILAEQLTLAAYHWSYAHHRAKFGIPISFDISGVPIEQAEPQNMLILAMGKFGGNELNFSSDIDLIFFYISDGKTIGAEKSIEHNRFFQKIGISIIKLLDEITEDGFVFRVDMRLRPYGDAGNLVMSVAQAEDYYHQQGRGWERFAMVRARIISGRSEEIQQLEEIISPFAFRRYIDYGVIDSLRNMKAMIQREVRRRGLVGNIKLGAGGIREIEFMVQSLQLIQGGRDKRLQEKNLLKVLPLLVQEKNLAKSIADDLKRNYRFLRRLEHCIQELDEKQTQQLPEDNDTQLVIAKLMGFDHWKPFSDQLGKRLENTNQHFNALFGEERTHAEGQDEFYLSLWESHISSNELNRKCELNEKCSVEIISILTSFKDSNLFLNLSERGANRLALFFPVLLEICLALEDPVQVLKRLIIILRSIVKRTAYLELLSENITLLQHLVDLVSRSDWIVKRLSECPILLDELLYPNSLYQPLQTSDLQSELRQSLLRIDEDDEEQILDAIRQFKLINELRVAAALLSERLGISQVSRYLTQLAEVIIQAGINHNWKNIVAKHGTPIELNDHIPSQLNHLNKERIETGFVVVGYGKLGSAELGFNSDLDLVFLFDPDPRSMTNGAKPISVSRFYTRFAQKLIHFLSTRTSLGVLYEVDMRLRPSGNSGLLVSHIDTFKHYQEESAWTWEHQALVRARVIAGDATLAKKFESVRLAVLSDTRDPIKLAKDVTDMRLKMQKELSQSDEGNIDLKQCEGGLVDIEFLAQYFALKGGVNNQIIEPHDTAFIPSSIIPTNTVEILKQAKSNLALSEADSAILIKNYRQYRNYLNQMALTFGTSMVEPNKFKDQIKQVRKVWRQVFG